MKKTLLLLFLLLFLFLCSCSAREDTLPSFHGKLSYIDHSWHALSVRLEKDGFSGDSVHELFSRMETPPSLRPMGAKIKELYTLKFMSPVKPSPQKQRSFATKLGVPGPWFKDVVTKANARLCKEFIQSNFNAFKRAEKAYGVPAEIGAALLFVETRLGRQLGKENAFYSLASMSTKFKLENILGYVDGLTDPWKHEDWISSRMEEKSEWAYRELKALLTYCHENGIDPFSVPGSMYGAIGLCQFMPTNIARYAEDGSDDGIIDLFHAPDAILSLSRYLSMNGWKRGMTQKEQIKALMRYNKMLRYAHTILALAKTVEALDKPEARFTSPKKVRANASKNAITKNKHTKSKAKAKNTATAKRSTVKKQKRWVTAKGRDITAYIDYPRRHEKRQEHFPPLFRGVCFGYPVSFSPALSQKRGGAPALLP